MKKVRGILGTGALLFAGAASAQVKDMPGGPRVNQLNLTEGVTKIAQDIMWIHWMMLIICAVIFVGVFGVMFYSILMHRKSRGAVAAKFHEHVGVEIAWTVIPFLIVIGMALPATRTVVAMKDTSSSDLTVKVTGYQWKWGYEYIDGPAQGVKFLSNLATPREQVTGQAPRSDLYLMEVDKPLVVPVNKKVRIVLTANDVIHSWMVPDFGVKQDAMPGFLRDTWFRAEKIGTYRGQCAELCGKDHAFMPIVVDVVSQEDYDKWAADQKKALAAAADDPNKEWTKDELFARGEKVYAANCVACHQANGKGLPNTFPALDGSDKYVLGPKKDQILTVLNGHPGTAMAAFRDQLNDVEIAAVITYTRNAWSNAGKGQDPVVQPADVKALR
ncbi:cytochrome c oxidase subunit II [Parapusillimonas granuli]|uniref:Cytochrome c oxidase subunit 2 n=1 Tax=Parapusillimonas granuli TaxID=380911 RepID=A0A853FQ05_9BURK|nr:cytochrome c oxidase subunit II [Parapusillimonas granuli]MBB5216196.1 cytochrome c oxidase subunit 2 [Parapusillimonas granuli]MEB2400472.1 cytochrome c oxidase subunit II [Alcaligenaceae bacterium]NYT47874.1 cytochrome c oxidase subunit II [Parapusillimonas granuli]